MPEDVTKKVAVTFSTGLPRGTCATFTHEKQQWIALPAPKLAAIEAVQDRLCGIYNGLLEDMVRWINTSPEDAPRIVLLTERVQRGRTLLRGLLDDKTTARTQ